MRMRLQLAFCFLIAMPSAAFAVDGRVLHTKDSTGTVLVIDDGNEVCRLAAGEECTWPISDGLHTVSVRRAEDGLCFGGVFAVPTNIPDAVFGAEGIEISPDPSLDSVSIWESC
jgi:hypothetical protein